MKKNILIGNGINIQFGGKDQYSNWAILHRLFENMKNGKYETILPACNKDEQLQMFQSMHDVIVDITHYTPSERYLFLQMEIERVKKQYNKEASLEDIGLEDYFLALEYAIKSEDSDEFVHQAKRELQMPMLDAIYNDGKINDLNYGSGFEKFIESFDSVYTINYDGNLDKYRSDVHHLHGEFSRLAPEYSIESNFSKANPDKCKANTMIPGFSHVYSNSIMSWYWLEKYGEWLDEESVYGADSFKKMEGKLAIVGMSPCNDEHLFLMINQSGISSVDYYYHSDDDRNRMQQKINKPITYRKVEKLWECLK